MINVFLADDHAVIRDGLRLLLESNADIRVVGAAGNGRQAVRQVRKLNPDIVVMDIAMPELNGIDAAARIHETCPDTKVVILSMHATKEHIYRALQAGARGYLLKESAGREVVDAVRAVYAGRLYLSKGISDTIATEFIRRRKTDPIKSPIETLSPREREILQLVVEGKTSAEIADILYLSPKTVETYRHRIMVKLDIDDMPGLVKFAIQHGLTPLE